MPVLSIKYADGTAGTLTFQCEQTLYDTAGNVITPPFEVVATLDEGSPSTASPELLSGLDPDVSPNPWSYRVIERITGQTERILFLTMPLTDADAVDVIVPEQPPAPELFVLKSVFDAHVAAGDEGGGGGGVTQAYVDAADAVLQGEIDDETAARETADDTLASGLVTANAVIDQEVIDRAADVDAEETRALAAEGTLQDNIDAETSRATGAEGTLTTNLAAEVTRATTAEGTNAAAISAETIRATTAEGTNASAIADETTRATTAEGLLAPKASPTLTGTVTIPDRTTGDNTTAAANTKFVQTASGLLVPKSVLTTKGDLIIATGSATPVRHGVGADGTFLVADSGQTDGWNNRKLAYTDMWTLPRCTVAASGPQTITSGSTGEILNTGVTESIDTHGFHSDTVNPERVTIPAGLGGTYLVMPKVSWQSSTGVGIRRVNVDINLGATTVTLYVLPAAASSAMNFGLSVIVTLADGDIMRIEAIHTQGADLTANMNEWTSIRIGP